MHLKGRDFVITTHPFADRRTVVRSVDGQERTQHQRGLVLRLIL